MIGVPVWNRGALFDKTLNAIANLDYPRENVTVVIAGGGTDESPALVKNFCKANSGGFRKLLFLEGNWTLPKTRNLIVECLTDEDFLLFIDSDIIVNSDTLSLALEDSKQYPIVHIDGLFYSQYSKNVEYRLKNVETDCVGLGCTLIASELCKSIRFDERLVWLPEDEDFLLRGERKIGRKRACLIERRHPVLHLAGERVVWNKRWQGQMRLRRSNAWNVYAVFRERRIFKLADDGKWIYRWGFYSVVFLCLCFSILFWPLVIVPVAFWIYQIVTEKASEPTLAGVLYRGTWRFGNALVLFPTMLYGEVEVLLQLRSKKYLEGLISIQSSSYNRGQGPDNPEVV